MNDAQIAYLRDCLDAGLSVYWTNNGDGLLRIAGIGTTADEPGIIAFLANSRGYIALYNVNPADIRAFADVTRMPVCNTNEDPMPDMQPDAPSEDGAEERIYEIEAREKFVVKTRYLITATSAAAAEELARSGTASYEEHTVEDDPGEWLETLSVAATDDDNDA